MKKVTIKQGYEDIFRQNNLKTFDDFYNFSNGKIIDKNTKRNVMTFSLQNPQGSETFFMKRYHNPHFKDLYFAYLNYGRGCTQGRLEWKNANYLIDNGINAYLPVAYGQYTICQLEKRSFMITKKLPGVCLADFVAKNWISLDENEKTKILKAVNLVVKRLYDTKISFRDLYLWHFFVDIVDSQYQLYMLDLHRMKKYSKSTRDRIKDLAALHYSLSDKYFTPQMKEIALFDTNKTDLRLKDKILKRAAKIQTRRGAPRY